VIRRLTWMVAVGVLAGSAAWAQNARVELSGTAGWTFSDGVSGGSVTVPGVGTFDRIDPKDAFSWGVRLGFMVTENVEVGALFNQQSTSLELGGTSTVKLGDEKLYNYHGYLAYNFGGADAKARPYILGGLGATQFGSVNVSLAGQSREVGGNTKFSTTWALGVKLNASPKVGIRLEGRWTPTYIKSDAAGWWCDPYWGCYVVGDSQYANQFELNGGITLRF
jgi:opacity protein-like surface antigen